MTFNYQSKYQASARNAFLAILGSIRYLARQGVAMRGHVEEQGNLMQLHTLRAKDINVLPAWLNHKTNFLSPESQNELLELFAHSIRRNIV